MRALHRLFGTFTACGLAMLIAQGVAGQDVSEQTVTYPEIDRQHDLAMSHYASNDGGLEETLWRHGRVAMLRQENDARRFECLMQQAQLLHSAGHTDASLQYLEEAGQQAEVTGNMFDAAMTFVDAAIVAQETRDDWSAREFAGQARSMVSLPELDINQRAVILKRLGQVW